MMYLVSFILYVAVWLWAGARGLCRLRQ